jgi:hypothetical protein
MFTISPNGILSNNGLETLIEAGRLFGAIQENVDLSASARPAV